MNHENKDEEVNSAVKKIKKDWQKEFTKSFSWTLKDLDTQVEDFGGFIEIIENAFTKEERYYS